MNAKQWNATMFSTMLVLAVIAVPFLAIAGDFDGGFLQDFDAGFDNMVDASFTFDDNSGFDFDANGGFTSDSSSGFGAGDIGSNGAGGFGFDPFDGDLGPFTGIPGNLPGTDMPVQPVVTPVVPPVIPVTPVTPHSGSDSDSSSDDSLRIFIHNIFLNNPFDELPGNQVPLRITFENTGTKDLDDTKVIVMIPDLSARATIGPMDVDSGEKATGTVFLDLPEDTEPGVYSVRLQIYNEDAQRIVHREVEVVDYS
jgi:hypothetical protein